MAEFNPTVYEIVNGMKSLPIPFVPYESLPWAETQVGRPTARKPTFAESLKKADTLRAVIALIRKEYGDDVADNVDLVARQAILFGESV
jgi:hypothetical protein